MKTRRRRGRKRQCVWCGVDFVPSPRQKDRQKTCGSDECKRRQDILAQKRWKRKESIIYRQGQSDWRKGHMGYWRLWRAKHPEYVVRNRTLIRLRKFLFKRKTGLQKKVDIAQLFKKQVKFARYCSLQRKLDRLFKYPSFISFPHERTQSYQERGSP